MTIHVDTSPLYTTRAGIARYVRGLLAGLRLGSPSPGAVHELGWPMENFSYAQPLRGLKTIAREWGWAKLIAPRQIAEGDVVHHTALPIVPFVGRARHVVTLHDLALLREPSRFRPWQRRAGLRRLQRVARADRIICVSRFTADEAIALLGVPAARITVIHEGGWLPEPRSLAAPTTIAPSVPAADFFLFVGSLEPGKNLALLREIYATARDGELPPLVIAGARWEGVAHEGPPPPGWQFLGHVPDVCLAELYQRARALVFPSRYEGFGLPVLEAMAQGCPVICGRVASLPEVGGDAACYADLTAASFGGAMRRVLRESGLAEAMRSTGKRRAAEFSWEKCARETAAVYDALTPA